MEEVNLNNYQLGENQVQLFIDVQCSLESFLEEFNEVVKEISKKIISSEKPTVQSLNTVLKK